MKIKIGVVQRDLTPIELEQASREFARENGLNWSFPSYVNIGDLVASSMPKYPRVIIGRVASFDADGEARGERGEHLGYFNRLDNSGNKKLTLLTIVDSSESLKNVLTENFPNLLNGI